MGVSEASGVATVAITALRQHGVNVKVLTGDNHLVTRKVCTEVGINVEKILLGKQVESSVCVPSWFNCQTPIENNCMNSRA